MLINADMKAARFLRWHEARTLLAWILSALDRGLDVYLVTAYKATKFSAKHRDYFKATRTGLYVRRGNRWECATYSKFVAQ